MQQEFGDAIVRSRALCAHRLEQGCMVEHIIAETRETIRQSIALIRRVSPGVSLHGLPDPIG
jgi:hypothetical protein